MNLGGAIGELLPPAIGIAISPIPIMATVMMLMSAQAKRTAPAFAAGWIAGLAVVGAIVLLVAGSADVSEGSGSDAAGWIKIALGLLFLWMAVGQWRKRPGPGEEAALPSWMAAIDRMEPMRALALAFALAAINPKSIALTVAAVLSIAQADLSGGQSAIALAVFIAIAASSVVVPVIGSVFFGERMQAPLLRVKDWLARENATVMFVVLLVLGATVLGTGIGDVTA